MSAPLRWHGGLLAVTAGLVERDLYDVGWHIDGSAYFAMRVLDGDSLAKRLHASPMPIAVACTVARQIASALAAAHAVGIVHRDLKPDNIVLVRDDEVAIGERATVLDFGIAKLLGDQPLSPKTRTGSVMGTPTYMSPEQCRGAGEVDHRTDVYAVGCMLFEMLTGRPPFVGSGAGEVIGMHQFVQPPSVRSLRGDVPPDLEAVVMRCVAKQPEQRYQTMTELVVTLQALTARGGSLELVAQPAVTASRPAAPTVRRITVPPLPSTLSGGHGEISTWRAPYRRRGVRFGLIGGGAVAVAMVAAVIAIVAGSGASSHPVARTVPGDAIEPDPGHSAPKRSPEASAAIPGDAAAAVVSDAVAATPSPEASGCFAEVSSEPTGADIVLGQTNVIGTTPQKVALPCGEQVELTIRKARLVVVTRTITPTPDGVKLSVALARQTFLVGVSSTLPGASVALNGKPLGVTPTTIKLPSFEHLTLTFAKEDYSAEAEVKAMSNGVHVHVTLSKRDRKKVP